MREACFHNVARFLPRRKRVPPSYNNEGQFSPLYIKGQGPNSKYECALSQGGVNQGGGVGMHIGDLCVIFKASRSSQKLR